nr:hypothetical protein [Natronorubrum halalkaliphilum]
MAASEYHRRSRHLERVESVTADETVRHVDQLDSDTLETVYEAVENDRPIPATEFGLEEGEIIVFTDYYRVNRA